MLVVLVALAGAPAFDAAPTGAAVAAEVGSTATDAPIATVITAMSGKLSLLD